MSQRNGVNEEANNRNRRLSVVVKRRRSSENNITLEGFRGFNIVPRVLIARYDITPYLNKLQYNRYEKFKQKYMLKNSMHSRRLGQKCYVNIVNQDLEKLKHDLTSQRNRKISTDFMSNLENDNKTDTIKCKFCEKSYSSEKKLHKHQEKKHTIVYKSENKTPKRVSFSDHVIIHEVKEYHKCRKCQNMFEEYDLLKKHMKQFHKKRAESVQNKNDDIVSNNELMTTIDDQKTKITFDGSNNIINIPETTIVDPKSKKTIISKHQCQMCGKYYSTNSTLKRHVETVHLNLNKLQCKVCEEIFVWPSLLETHKCIRLNIPEMPFQDSRPEIHFDNLNEIGQNGFDDFNISENDNYMNSIDFEIPEPIVDLTEGEEFIHRSQENQDIFAPLSNLGYKIIMQQEVPIEF